jgi:hypothetical protein
VKLPTRANDHGRRCVKHSTWFRVIYEVIECFKESTVHIEESLASDEERAQLEVKNQS